MWTINISQNGINFIKQWEGLFLKSYDDGVGVWTIGYGHTKGVKSGQTITLEQAEQFLKDDLKEFENAVNSLGLSLTQNQFDSLVSFLFNVGTGALSTEYKIGRDLKSGNLNNVPSDMLAWCNGGGHYIQGLYNRRVAEANLFKEHSVANITSNIKALRESDFSEMSKVFQNGSTSEQIWTSNEHTNLVGSLEPHEKCKCLGVHNGHAIVQYVGSHNYDKVGFTSCKVADKNGTIVPLP